MLINGWKIEIVEGDKVLFFSEEELELENKDPNYVSLNGLLSNMSYEDNKEFWDEEESDYEEQLDFDEDKVKQIVKDFFKDQKIEINIKQTTLDT